MRGALAAQVEQVGFMRKWLNAALCTPALVRGCALENRVSVANALSSVVMRLRTGEGEGEGEGEGAERWVGAAKQCKRAHSPAPSPSAAHRCDNP